MLIRRATVTPPRETPDAELARVKTLIRVVYDREDDLLRRQIATAWNLVERHTGRLWLPAANDGDRTATAEIALATGDRVPLLPRYPQTPDPTLGAIQRWTDGAWTDAGDVDRLDPWHWIAPSTDAYRVTATWSAPEGDPPHHVRQAIDRIVGYLHEMRGSAATTDDVPVSHAGALIRSGAGELLMAEHRVAL